MSDSEGTNSEPDSNSDLEPAVAPSPVSKPPPNNLPPPPPNVRPTPPASKPPPSMPPAPPPSMSSSLGSSSGSLTPSMTSSIGQGMGPPSSLGKAPSPLSAADTRTIIEEEGEEYEENQQEEDGKEENGQEYPEGESQDELPSKQAEHAQGFQPEEQPGDEETIIIFAPEKDDDVVGSTGEETGSPASPPQPPPQPPPPSVDQLASKFYKANFDYANSDNDPDTLSLKVGDILVVLETRADGWWRGQSGNRTGLFPVTYCEPISEDEVKAFIVKASKHSVSSGAGGGNRAELEKEMKQLQAEEAELAAQKTALTEEVHKMKEDAKKLRKSTREDILEDFETLPSSIYHIPLLDSVQHDISTSAIGIAKFVDLEVEHKESLPSVLETFAVFFEEAQKATSADSKLKTEVEKTTNKILSVQKYISDELANADVDQTRRVIDLLHLLAAKTGEFEFGQVPLNQASSSSATAESPDQDSTQSPRSEKKKKKKKGQPGEEPPAEEDGPVADEPQDSEVAVDGDKKKKKKKKTEAPEELSPPIPEPVIKSPRKKDKDKEKDKEKDTEPPSSEEKSKLKKSKKDK